MIKNKIIFLVCSVLLLQGFLAAANDAKDNQGPVVPKKIAKLLSKGDDALKEKKIEEALKYYNQALAEDANIVATYICLANVNFVQQKLAEALPYLQKAYQLSPEDPKVISYYCKTLFNLGNEVFKNKNMEKALEYFNEILEVKNIVATEKAIYVKSNYLAGIVSFNLQKTAETEKYFVDLLNTADLEKEYPEIYGMSQYMLGVLYSQLNDFAKANEYLIKYIEIKKDKPGDTYVPMANFLIGSNNYDALYKEVEKIKAEPEATPPAIKKGSKKPVLPATPSKRDRIMELAKKNDNIEPYLKKAIEIKPDINDQVYLILGNFYYLLEDLENAKGYYQILLDKFPTSSDIEAYKKFMETIKKEINDKAKEKKSK